MSKVLIAAGGSGGHLFPAQQLAEMLQRKGSEILFAGYKLSYSPFFLRQNSISFIDVPAARLTDFSFFWVLMKGVWKSIRILQKFKPDVVVSFGSYHVFPVVLAAAILRKKIVLFEANCTLGKVNRFFSRRASCIATQFPIKKGVLVPLLPWISHDERYTAQEARREYGLDPEMLTLLIFGGSQGSHFLNEKIPEALQDLKQNIQVIHFTGKESSSTQKMYEQFKIKAHVAPFEPQMAKAYAAADCAICRSGAGTIAELIQRQIPALLIPFPEAAEEHQKVNGQYLASRGAARLLIQSEAHRERLKSEIEKLILEREAKRLFLQKMDLQNVNRCDFADLVRNLGDAE